MIYQNEQNENTQNKFFYTIKELEIGKLMRKSNITKNCGISTFEIFQFLFLLEWIKRIGNYERSYGKLFYLLVMISVIWI